MPEAAHAVPMVRIPVNARGLALTILAVVGLPIVTALAWSYEITPGGIVLDSELTGNVRLPRARRAVAPAIVLGVSLMATVTGFAWWQSISAEPGTPAVPPDPGYPSVAVLPLVDMSPAGGIAYLGDGLSEELSSDLAKLPGLRVAARTSESVKEVPSASGQERASR